MSTHLNGHASEVLEIRQAVVNVDQTERQPVYHGDFDPGDLRQVRNAFERKLDRMVNSGHLTDAARVVMVSNQRYDDWREQRHRERWVEQRAMQETPLDEAIAHAKQSKKMIEQLRRISQHLGDNNETTDALVRKAQHSALAKMAYIASKHLS